MTFFGELKRRNVIRMGAAYILGAWVLLQGIDFVLDVISAPNWILQVFLLAAVAGFPVVLITSWIFEITPEGIRREKDIDRSQSIIPETGRKLDRVIMVFLAVAVVILLADRFLGTPSEGSGEQAAMSPVESPQAAEERSSQENARPAPETPGDKPAENSIAVLPFVNMSSDPEQEYFSDGITEEILNRLASIRELQVAARTSVFSFKGQNQDVREIAGKLGVSTILEGSVRKAGDQVRITAQLIRASDGFHLWSEAYDRKLENIFAIQDDIASRIAEALQISMGVSDQPPEQPRLVNPEVYDLYLQARALHRKREDLLRAIDLFKQALAIDPDFAPAWAGLSHTYIVIPNYISPEEHERLGDVLGKSLDAAEKALALDPDLPTAIHAMANNLLFQYQWAEAERYYLKALELDPDSADIMEDYASLLANSVQLEKARSVADRMIELDPYVPVFHNAMVSVLQLQGEHELLDRHIEAALEINPELPNIQSLKFNRLMNQGQYEEAREFAPTMNDEIFSNQTLQKTIDWLEAGGTGTPDSGLTNWLADNPYLYFDAGRYDLWIDSVDEIGRVWPEWELTSLYVLATPTDRPDLLHRFRSDPRTKTYLERIRLPEYWRQVGWPDFCRPLGENDFECF